VKPIRALICETRVAIFLASIVGLLGLAVGGEERLGSVQDVYDGTLPLEVEVNTFRHIDRVFPSAVVKHGGRVFPLPQATRQLRDVTFLSRGRQLHLADYIRLNRVAAVLVLKDSQIALERYEFGNTPQTRWVSFSVVKSITSTLAAAAVQDRLIGGLNDPVTNYLPQLRRSAYDGASIRNVLQMASGVAGTRLTQTRRLTAARCWICKRSSDRVRFFISWRLCPAPLDPEPSGTITRVKLMCWGRLSGQP
jgi:hypothetical protein